MSAVEETYLVTDVDLVAVVTLALEIPIRTVAQQEALLRVTRAMDNDFVQWSAEATASWEGRRCSCGRAIPVLSDNCAACRRGERVAS